MFSNHLMDKSDVVTCNAMILSFAELRMENLALHYFRKMQSMGLQNDQTTISTIFPVCDLESGKQIHTYITKSNLSLVISVCNALINMYSRYGCIGTAYFVFSNMVSRDLVSWNTMIDLVEVGFSKAPVRCFLLF